MRPALHLIAFLASCAVFSAGGWWLAFSRPAPAMDGASAGGKAGFAMPRRDGKPVAEEEVDEQVEIPLTHNDVMRGMMGRVRTEDLWRLLLSRSGPDFFFSNDIILEELADRLGWAVWDRALALEDPAARAVVTDGILAILAKRDPWRAFETWRDHRQEFRGDSADPDDPWGCRAMMLATEGIGQGSASQMIEMLSSFGDLGYFPRCVPEYAHGFDFGAVVDFLIGGERKIPARPENLLTEWSRQSPVAAGEWILAHAGTLSDSEWWASQTGRTLHEIARLAPGTPGRAEALEVLSRLPEEQLNHAWAGSSGKTQGTLSAGELEAAEAMGRKEEFLWGSFFTTRESDSLDPSWQLLSSADRQLMLEKMEEKRGPVDKLTKVQNESWQRWRKMVTTAWGLMEKP